MTKTFKHTFCVAVLIALAAQPALAQQRKPATAAGPVTAGGAIVPGLAVANLDAAIANSNAFKIAEQQRQTSYKATYDAVQARAVQIDAQLKPLIDKFNADSAAKQSDAILQVDAAAFQTAQERGKQELQQLAAPVSLSQAYVDEQIQDKLNQAVQNAMQKRGVTMLLRPDAVLARAGTYELTPAIIAELNVLIPAVQIVPPPGWLPRQLREQQAQQQPRPATGTAPVAPRPTTTAPKPAGPQPEGR